MASRNPSRNVGISIYIRPMIRFVDLFWENHLFYDAYFSPFRQSCLFLKMSPTLNSEEPFVPLDDSNLMSPPSFE